MEFFASAITTLQTLVVALGAGLGVWGVVNLLEGYGSDNPGSNSAGRQHSLLSPLDCLPAKAGGAVNGGAYAPFILTVDWLGWPCYLNLQQ